MSVETVDPRAVAAAAIAAAGKDESGQFTVVVVTGEGTVVRSRQNPRSARAAVALSVEMQIGELLGGWRMNNPRLVRGVWTMSALCSDGEVRVFTERRPGRRQQRAKMPPELRFAVLARDGFRCRYCGRAAPEVPLHVDHVHPVSAGGADTMENLATACVDCNIGKSDAQGIVSGNVSGDSTGSPDFEHGQP